MRAVTGAIVSSEPCSIAQAAQMLACFCDSAASHLPSSDAFTYLRAAADAATHHRLFRRYLFRPHADGGAEREEKRRLERGRDGERDADLVVAAGGGPHGPAAEVGIDAGEKKSKNKREEVKEEDTDAAGIASYIPASPEITGGKRKLKKQKHGEEGRESSGVKEDAGFVGEVETGSERKKKDKKKREKDRVKLEEEAKDVKEVVAQMAVDGDADQAIASGEKKKKKRKHAEELGDTKGVKEEKMATDGDLGSEKKRKKKRGRGADDSNDLDQVEHTKKQKKQT